MIRDENESESEGYRELGETKLHGGDEWVEKCLVAQIMDHLGCDSVSSIKIDLTTFPFSFKPNIAYFLPSHLSSGLQDVNV